MVIINVKITCMNDHFFTPKSVYKGTRADGSKFTVEEWDFFSFGNFNGQGLITLVFAAFLMVIVSPISLIYAVLTYSGKIKISNILGIIFSCYFLYDVNHGWLGSMFTQIFISDSTMNFLIAINISSLIAHVILLILTLIFAGKFNVYPRMWWLSVFMLCFLFIGYQYGKKITTEHGTYNAVTIREMSEKEKDDAYTNFLLNSPSLEEQVKYREEHGI
jgi:small-conductance mechanosensitive channel